MTAQDLLAYVNQHREWAAWVVFALAVVETIPVLSTIMFSTPFIVGMGTLVSAGAVDFLPIFIGAAAGAVTGSSLSWWLGHYFGRRILKSRAASDHADWLSRASAAMNRWGLAAVGLAHVFPPITSVIFLFAGMTRVPFWRFQLVNVPGALLQAYLYPKSGEWGGDLAQILWSWFTAHP